MFEGWFRGVFQIILIYLQKNVTFCGAALSIGLNE